MSDLNTLIRKRGGLKRSLTEFRKALDVIYSEQENEGKVNRETIIQLECRLEVFQNLLDKFQDVQFEINNLENSENYEDINDFETLYFNAISRAKYLIERNQPEVVTTQSDPSTRSNHSNSGSGCNIHLPKIALPTFSGKYTEWLAFRDIFQAMIHDSDKLSPIQKLYYLNASLEGEAKKSISSITLSASNYNVAWTILCQRYENKRLLVHNHIRALFELNSIKFETAIAFRDILDSINNHLHSLATLGQPTESWDAIIVYIVISKFNSKTAREWESHVESVEYPSLESLKLFLQKRAEMLETLEFSKTETVSSTANIRGRTASSKRALVTTNGRCYFCEGAHGIFKCGKFLDLNIKSRNTIIKSKGLCINCLRPGHMAKECDSGACKKCRKKHNTLLHDDEKQEVQQETSSVQTTERAVTLFTHSNDGCLSTAQVKVGQNPVVTARVILDTGSQSNFISKGLAMKIHADIKPCNTRIAALSNYTTNTLGTCEVFIRSKINNFKIRVKCHVINDIADYAPLPTIEGPIGNEIKLADPNYNQFGTIDLLLGNGLFWNLVTEGNFKVNKCNLILQNTVFGWIFAGPMINSSLLARTQCAVSKTCESVQAQLARFWEIEELLEQRLCSEEEQFCEQQFTQNLARNSDGRFIVQIPLKASINLLGDSKQGALKRFYNLERKLQTNSNLKSQYVTFMREYEDMKHMSKIEEDNNDSVHYYIPHHGVTNEASCTTKLRVVFNASHQTTTGLSFNDIQCVGPTIQQDLHSILLRFRKHTIAMSADITKMYRQILIKPSMRDLQRIVWRAEPTDPIAIYRLNTVTYGTAAASFLAIRCLQQLAIENKERYPEAAMAIANDFYVDDLLSGTDDEELAARLCQQISTILQKGCFPIRKWLSNRPDVLKDVTNEKDEHSILIVGKNENTKTLGLFWAPNEDNLAFKVNTTAVKNITKRTILSAISQIFDPLGLLGPCIISIKMILQLIWMEKLDWDDEVPQNIQDKWRKIQCKLHLVNQILIPRHAVLPNSVSINLHGFADASQVAYGGCVYIQSYDQLGNTSINLLCSKSKVAPLKTLTMPRLELCAAALLAKLVRKIITSWSIKFNKMCLWSDSQIVLAWLRTTPNVLKIFVANRVVQIHELCSEAEWKYVPSTSNPADHLSRGLTPEELQNSRSWWHGPTWLESSEENWPTQPNILNSNKLPELRATQVACTTISVEPVISIERFSMITRLYRVIAMCARFTYNLRHAQNERMYGPINAAELKQAQEISCKIVQQEIYKQELHDLKLKGHVKKSSSIIALSPFLDSNGLMRVGGRLQSSDLTYQERHPIILPGKHHFTKLLLQDVHAKQGHIGVNQMITTLRQQFWPVRVRTIAKQTVRECIRCFRTKPVNAYQVMGILPRDRVSPSFPFEITGIDYAGPFFIKFSKGRGARSIKCYLAVFVCFTTKAVHLELVSDLTTEAFLASLRRFVSRRGRPRIIYSDNATNFIGAERELGQLLTTVQKDSDRVECELAKDGITWKFIPPRSPHFGGLWEAAVKRAKFHFKRMTSSTLLTFEEMYTLICQIEAILNSRPLTPLSDDPNDLTPLTPSHFLIGRKLTGIPEPSLDAIKADGRCNFKLLQRLMKTFWERWSHEYLQLLNPRSKWRAFDSHVVKPGDLVLMEDEGHPPLSWPLGRVQEVFPGPDGKIRVASVKTPRGEYRRTITKLYPLPGDLVKVNSA